MIAFVRFCIIILLCAFASCDHLAEPSGESGGIQLVLDDTPGQVSPSVSLLLGRAGVPGISAGSQSTSILGKASGTATINEARLFILDASKWASQQDFNIALMNEPDSVYDRNLIDPRRDLWDNLLAIFKGYHGNTYFFAGEYFLPIIAGSARITVNVNPGLNLFFAALRDNKQTVYMYSALLRIFPNQQTPVVLNQTFIQKILLNSIAVWDTTRWSSLGDGVNGEVNAVAVSGTDVYAGGRFSFAGNIAANNIAKWNGSTWSALGLGLDSAVTGIGVSGGNVYAVGQFQSAGGSPANRVAVWNGTSWSAVGSGLNGIASSIAVDGAAIYVGGSFSTAGGAGANNIASWNGTTWSALGTGTNGLVLAIAPNGLGGIYAGGAFSSAGAQAGTNGIAFWNGTSWTSVGGGVGPAAGYVRSLTVNGANVMAGGLFNTAGSTSANNIALWNGTVWAALSIGTNGVVRATARSGQLLFAGGFFQGAGGRIMNNIAMYDTSSWKALRTGLDGPVNTIVTSGQRVFVGGVFNYTF